MDIETAKKIEELELNVKDRKHRLIIGFLAVILFVGLMILVVYMIEFEQLLYYELCSIAVSILFALGRRWEKKQMSKKTIVLGGGSVVVIGLILKELIKSVSSKKLYETIGIVMYCGIFNFFIVMYFFMVWELWRFMKERRELRE